MILKNRFEKRHSSGIWRYDLLVTIIFWAVFTEYYLASHDVVTSLIGTVYGMLWLAWPFTAVAKVWKEWQWVKTDCELDEFLEGLEVA